MAFYHVHLMLFCPDETRWSSICRVSATDIPTQNSNQSTMHSRASRYLTQRKITALTIEKVLALRFQFSNFNKIAQCVAELLTSQPISPASQRGLMGSKIDAKFRNFYPSKNRGPKKKCLNVKFGIVWPHSPLKTIWGPLSMAPNWPV